MHLICGVNMDCYVQIIIYLIFLIISKPAIALDLKLDNEALLGTVNYQYQDSTLNTHGQGNLNG